MTPDQISLVQTSFAKVAPISDKAAELFYGRLFEIAPQVRALFPDDMTDQRKKLMATLAVVVKGLSNLDTILPAASALAKRHVRYGAEPAHYPVVGAVLIASMAEVAGPGWRPEYEDAWAEAYSIVAGAMLAGAAAELGEAA